MASYTYYHAGPLFHLADLTTNIALSQAIQRLSSQKFQPILPQNLVQNDGPHRIRDEDLHTLLSCDLALFTYDGSELDSGTVVEYMFAKMADIPAVILRSDFRGGGDQEGAGDPWNLMSSFYPRTSRVVVHAMSRYRAGMTDAMADDVARAEAATNRDRDPISNTPSALKQNDYGPQTAAAMIDDVARQIIDAFEKVLAQPPRMPPHLRKSVYSWLALMPGFADGNDASNVALMQALLEGKESKGLL